MRTEVKSEDIHKLEYVGCVFKEVLRKFPPAVQFVRETDGEFSINGYSIPIGSIIAVNFLTYSTYLYGYNKFCVFLGVSLFDGQNF